MAKNLPIIFQAAALPEGFTGTPQQFFDAMIERMRAYVESDYSIFVTGSSAPTSNQGPWLKDGKEWRFWSDVTGSYSLSSVPVGTLHDFAGNSPPDGYLLAQGQVVDKAQYPDLFATIGIIWNVGDEIPTQFRLPDTRGCTLIGQGQRAGLTNRTIGTFLGEESHQLTIPELPAHTHGGGMQARQPSGSDTINHSSSDLYNYNRTSASTGGDVAHNNMQPSLVTCKIIKY